MHDVGNRFISRSCVLPPPVGVCLTDTQVGVRARRATRGAIAEVLAFTTASRDSARRLAAYDGAVLAQVLPGVRHLRTPLITGYLYFVLVWMVLGANRVVPTAESANSWERYLADLFQLMGRGGTAVAVTTAAYLVGSMLMVTRFAAPERAMWRAGDVLPITRSNQPTYLWALDVARDLHPDLTYRLVLSQAGLSERFASAVREWWSKNDGAERDRSGALIGQLNFTHHLDDRVEREALAVALTAALSDEFKLLSLRLQIERETLYNEFDRLRNEAELRFSIAVPLVLFVGVASVEWHWQAAIGLLLPTALVTQGVLTERKAHLRVMEALIHGVVESPVVSLLRSLEPVTPPTESERAIEELKKASWLAAWRELRTMRRDEQRLRSPY